MKLRRVLAYFIDLAFIVLLVGMLNQLRFLNPNFEEYYDASVKYNEEYLNILENGDINFITESEYKELVYDLQKTGITNIAVEIIVYIGYFVFFQYFNRGQTLGKKALRIKVVDVNNKLPKWYQLLIRTIIIYSLYVNLIVIVFINLIDKNHFMNLYNCLNIINIFVVYISVFMILFRKDGCGIHDLISKTKVIKE